jgi:hypothetical protein
VVGSGDFAGDTLGQRRISGVRVVISNANQLAVDGAKMAWTALNAVEATACANRAKITGLATNKTVGANAGKRILPGRRDVVVVLIVQ